MIQENIRESMIVAMKAKDSVAKEVYSLLLSNLKNKAIELKTEVLSDNDSIQVIRKFVKGLTEEKESFEKAGRAERVEELEMQISLVRKFLPTMLEENEIRAIIADLDDKSVKGIMIYFKTTYPGRVDMGLVNKVAKEFIL